MGYSIISLRGGGRGRFLWIGNCGKAGGERVEPKDRIVCDIEGSLNFQKRVICYLNTSLYKV